MQFVKYYSVYFLYLIAYVWHTPIHITIVYERAICTDECWVNG